MSSSSIIGTSRKAIFAKMQTTDIIALNHDISVLV